MEPTQSPGARHERRFKFLINGADQVPGGPTFGPCECQLTKQDLIITDSKGKGTKQLLLRDITRIEPHVGPFSRKRLVLNTADAAVVIFCGDKDEVLDIKAMVEVALEG